MVLECQSIQTFQNSLSLPPPPPGILWWFDVTTRVEGEGGEIGIFLYNDHLKPFEVKRNKIDHQLLKYQNFLYHF